MESVAVEIETRHTVEDLRALAPQIGAGTG
jgi:hypothetical protein